MKCHKIERFHLVKTIENGNFLEVEKIGRYSCLIVWGRSHLKVVSFLEVKIFRNWKLSVIAGLRILRIIPLGGFFYHVFVLAGSFVQRLLTHTHVHVKIWCNLMIDDKMGQLDGKNLNYNIHKFGRRCAVIELWKIFG